MAKILIIVLGSDLIAAAAFVAVAIVIAARAGSRGGGKHDHYYGTAGGPAANTSAHGPSHAKPAPRERIDQRQSPASELL